MNTSPASHLLALTCAAIFLSGCDENPARPELAGRYVVVLMDTVENTDAVVDELVARHGATLTFRYSGGVIQGFAGFVPEKNVELVRSDERVEYIVPVQPVEVRPVSHSLYRQTVGSQLLPWGVDTVGADISSTRAGNGSGAVASVHVYVLDTGIAAHPDLNLAGHVNFAGGVNTDCNGHGTHVAGTVAARDNGVGVVGVAPGAPVYGVKVLDCNGSGTSSAVIKGVNWVVKNAKRPAVINMSLGTGTHALALHDAIVRAIGTGIVVVVAAGNTNINAGTSEPAHVPEAITVGATAQNRCKASFSNWGAVLDIFAPGDQILSTWLNGQLAFSTGTSMAAPHVAGGAALVLQKTPAATPAQVRSALVQRGRAVVNCGFTASAQNNVTTDLLESVAAF